jgi:hypothetical protein
MVESKYCTDCEEMRPATDFNKKRASCDGLQSVCVFHMMIRQGVVTNFIPHWGVLYCPRCDKFLPLDQFAVARRRRTGRQGKCRQCMKLDRPSKEAQATYQRKRRATSPEMVAHVRMKCREYYEKTKLQQLARMVDWRANNKGTHREAVTRWKREHPEAVRNANKRRWHRRRATGGSFTQREWEDKCKIYDNCCAYCKDPDAKLTIHHVIPVARGGSSNIDNLVPACRSCNSHIGIRITIPDEPIAEGGLPS